MQTQYFLSRLVESFEEECYKIMNQSHQNDHDHPIKLVQTLRISNKVEIANIITKFKRLFMDIVNQTLYFIEKECNLFLTQQILPVSKYLSLLEHQKKIISQKEQQITDLLLDNMQFQAQLKDIHLKSDLTHSYIIEIDSLNQKIEDQEVQIKQLKIQLEKLHQQIKDFEILQQQKLQQKPEKANQKQRISDRKKTLDQYYDEYESPKANFEKIEIEYSKNKEPQHVEQFKKTKEISCQSEMNSFHEINFCESQVISNVVNKRLKNENKNDLINLSSIIRRVQHHAPSSKFPSIRNETIIIEKSIRNKSIQFNRPKKMDDLYLYSRSQRNSSVNVNMDHYYEAPTIFRYDVLNRTRKLS